MAAHFSANQYDQAFDSKRLQNWQLPHTYKERPTCHDGFTQIIANNQGHLLEGVPKSSENPWGSFVGTWDMPLKIPGNVTTFIARSDPAATNIVRGRKNHEELMRRAAGSPVKLAQKKSPPKVCSPEKPSESPPKSPFSKSPERPCNPTPPSKTENLSTSPRDAAKTTTEQAAKSPEQTPKSPQPDTE